MRDLGALGERAEMVATVTAAIDPHMLPRGPGEFGYHPRRDRLLAGAFQHGLSALGVGLRLIASCLEAGGTVLQLRVVQIGHARLDGVIKLLEPKVGLGGALVQFGDVLTRTARALLTAVQNGSQHCVKPRGFTVVPDWAAKSLPGTRHGIEIGRQCAECSAAHG